MNCRSWKPRPVGYLDMKGNFSVIDPLLMGDCTEPVQRVLKMAEFEFFCSGLQVCRCFRVK